VTDVVRPLHGQTRIDGLRVHDGWSCKVGRCTSVSTNRDVIRQHCGQAHRLKIKAAGMMSRVRLQTLFLKNPRYFIVTVLEVDLRRFSKRLAAAAIDAARFASLGQQLRLAMLTPGAPCHGSRRRARLRDHAVAAAHAVSRTPRRPRCRRVHGGVQGLEDGRGRELERRRGVFLRMPQG
jgi:hypothetical protein